jgi:cytochrome c553
MQKATGLAACVLLTLASTLSTPCRAADANYARNLAAACAGCHGTDGVSAGIMPSLVGQDRAVLIQQLQDFKNGRRPSTVMQQISKGYTDEQLEIISGYFAQKKAAARGF